jgi:hypothetical protein
MHHDRDEGQAFLVGFRGRVQLDGELRLRQVQNFGEQAGDTLPVCSVFLLLKGVIGEAGLDSRTAL